MNEADQEKYYQTQHDYVSGKISEAEALKTLSSLGVDPDDATEILAICTGESDCVEVEGASCRESMKITPERAARFQAADFVLLSKEEADNRPRGPKSLDQVDREYREKQAKLAAEREKKL